MKNYRGKYIYSPHYVTRLAGRIRNLENRLKGISDTIYFKSDWIKHMDGKFHAEPMRGDMPITGAQEHLGPPATRDEVIERAMGYLSNISDMCKMKGRRWQGK